MAILDDFISKEEAAEQLGVSPRTINRMMAKREIAFTYVGKTPRIQVSSTREALLSRVIKPVTERRGRK
jgi:excisionase family DNA binding protein